MKKCPYCERLIDNEAVICNHCNTSLETKKIDTISIVFDYMMKGILLYKSGKYDEAIGEFNNIIEIKSKYKTAYYKRAIVYNAMGNQKAVLEDLRTAARLGYKEAQHVLESKNIKY